MVSGFYRYVRNPMYVGVMVALAGEATLFWSRDILIEALLAFLFLISSSRLHEEPSLIRRYADEYPLYKGNVPRWLPRLSPVGRPPILISGNLSRPRSVQSLQGCGRVYP